MVEISYKKHVKVNESKELVVCYNLISEGKKYHVECYVENAKEKDNTTYCEMKDFTRNRQKGFQFVEMIAKGEVLPVHVLDIMEDFFEE